MDNEEIKIFKKTSLVIIILTAFIINYLSNVFYSVKLDWEDASEAYIFGKSATSPIMFFVWLLSIPIIVKIKNKFPYTKARRWSILIHLFFSILLTSIISIVSELLTICLIYTFDKVYSLEYLHQYFGNLGMYLFDIKFEGVVIYWLIIIYLTSVDYFEKYKDESLKRAQAENLISKAELSALKMQIQPHFLYNTLHSISSLIDIDKEEAQEVIGRLGELMRYTLAQQKNDFILLKTELLFIENYLQIEKARFKDRLNIEYEIENKTENVYISGFILQPLIENAIKHGLSKTNRKCNILLKTSIYDDTLQIVVSDDGNGSSHIIKGVGLDNTEQRLKNHYSNNYEFSYYNIEPHGFEVVIKIPIIIE